MKLVMNGNMVFASHEDWQNIVGLYDNSFDIVHVPAFTHIDVGGADPRLSMDVETVRQCRLQDLKEIANETIVSSYPLYKQLNIIRGAFPYTEADKTTMEAFIDGIRTLTDEIETLINLANTSEDVVGISLDAVKNFTINEDEQ